MPSIVRFVFNEVSAQCVALLLLGKDRTMVEIFIFCLEFFFEQREDSIHNWCPGPGLQVDSGFGKSLDMFGYFRINSDIFIHRLRLYMYIFKDVWICLNTFVNIQICSDKF